MRLPRNGISGVAPVAPLFSNKRKSHMAQEVGTKAVVPVKSAATSKINWTAILSSAAMLGSYFGLDLNAGQVGAVVTAVGVGSQLVQLVLRTFFTKSVVASST